jgi:hypothetical protein
LNFLNGSGQLWPDVLSQTAFGAIYELVADFRPLLKGPKSIHLDGGEMSENIASPSIGLDEAKSFGVIEPFDDTDSVHKSFLLMPFLAYEVHCLGVLQHLSIVLKGDATPFLGNAVKRGGALVFFCNRAQAQQGDDVQVPICL